ncbi:MAG: DUF1800 domain-containing protein [Bacteroidota bacterium]
MDRRAFFGGTLQRTKVADPTPTDPVKGGKIDPVDELVNQELPQLQGVTTGLEAYTGAFGWEEARHLLNRALFGAKKAEVDQAVQDGLEATLDKLVADWEEPSPPVYYQHDRDVNVPIGSTWIASQQNNGDGVNNFGSRWRTLVYWSIGQMITQEVSLREKIAMFWHNHFSTELLASGGDARFSYQLVRLFRLHGLGNVKTLVEEVTVNPAMLHYLNGNQNRNGSPNENYARELFELFTIGKGPQIGEGNYTNYTEEDIREAAKVLTGWQATGGNRGGGITGSEYRDGRHDNTTKQFSEAFNYQVIENQGEDEYKALIDMIFQQAETARYICRKLYRWFCYYVIDEYAEENVIEPMAQLLIANNYEVKPVVRALLSSAHFFDTLRRGCIIKSPIEFVVSLMRKLEFDIPPVEEELNFTYRVWNYIYSEASKLQQTYLSPPSVAGWPAYYQEPIYYQAWVNSATLPNRQFFSRSIMAARGKSIYRADMRLKINVFTLLSQVSDPADPNLVVREIGEVLFPFGVTDNQLIFLKDVLIPGLPDFEWTEEYVLYITDPDDPEPRMAVENRLRAMVETMISLPEIHLS